MPPWVWVPTIGSLSPKTFFGLGERVRVRGKTRLFAKITLHAPFRDDILEPMEQGTDLTDEYVAPDGA